MRRILRVPRRRGASVLDANGASVTVEGPEEIATAGSVALVAVLAHWSKVARVNRSVAAITAALVDAGYHVVVVSTSEDAAPLAWPAPPPDAVTVVRRPNLGYDFGSWATALDRYPLIMDADRVLLLNDSMVGPFTSIDRLLGSFHACQADVWAATDSAQFAYHLQSYMLGFQGRSLREPSLRRFWHDVRVEPTKDDVIWRGEIGLSQLLRRERFASDVAIPYRHIVRGGSNPAIIGWRKLLDRGFPFVKRELVLNPRVAPDGGDVREELRRRFGVDVDEWL